MSSEAKNPRIEAVQGGCLCEAIRYTITFPPDHDFSKSATTCQCEQCRKNTGSLLGRFHAVRTTSLSFSSPSSSPPALSPPTLKRYYATPGIARGFCSACGSFLFWERESTPLTYVAVGTLDKKHLVGGGEEAMLLATAARNFWCAEEVPGVTDHLRGERWKYDNDEGGELMPLKSRL